MTDLTSFSLMAFQSFKAYWNRRVFLGSFILGLLLNLALPPFGVWMIIPFSLSPLFFMLEKQISQKKVFFLGFWYFFGYFFGGLYWIAISLSVDWTKFFWLLPFSCFGIPFALGLMMAPTCYAFWKFKDRPFWAVFFFAFSAFILDITRTYIFPQFPWNLLGYTLASSPWFLQSASIIGVFGLGILVIFLGSLLYFFRKTEHRFLGECTFLFLVLIFLGGGIRLFLTPPQFLEYSLRLVQPNVPQNFKWIDSFKISILKKLLSLSSGPSNPSHPLLILWPETAVPFFLEEDPSLRHHLTEILPSHALLITGGGRRITTPASLRLKTIKAWNSLFILDPKGEILDFYDKVHLVPFGEYVPFRNILKDTSLKKLTHGTLDFSQGDQRPHLQVQSFPAFSPLICYEIAFPHCVLNPELSRPEWILNITNDAWFGKSTGPYQHLQMAQVRAVEEGLPVVRIANTGISAVIDPSGRILNSLALNEEGVIDTWLPKALPCSFYSLYGNWMPLYLLLILGTFFEGLARLKRFLKK